jgi:hypothetical protein
MIGLSRCRVELGVGGLMEGDEWELLLKILGNGVGRPLVAVGRL